MTDPFAGLSKGHYRRGWLLMFPNAWMHHHNYGVELAWICDCPIPGLKYQYHRETRGAA